MTGVVISRVENGWIVEHDGTVVVEQGNTTNIRVMRSDGSWWEARAVFYPPGTADSLGPRGES